VYEHVDNEDCDCFCFQGVEFFDEKLNALFMAWLLDHGTEGAIAFLYRQRVCDDVCLLIAQLLCDIWGWN